MNANLISEYRDAETRDLILITKPSLAQMLRAFLATHDGYDGAFCLYSNGDMSDAENRCVPDLSDLCMGNPALVGIGLAWLADEIESTQSQLLG